MYYKAYNKAIKVGLSMLQLKAGCQVVQKQTDFDACITDLYASKQKEYSYILLDASKL